MSLKAECSSYLTNAKTELNTTLPKKEQLTDNLFTIFLNFADNDYENISENKIYRSFLNTLIEIIELAFESRASKSFLRSFFKKLSNKAVTDYLSNLAPKHTSD